MTARRTQLLRSIYVFYGILVIAMTVFLLHGRLSPLDKNLTLVELVCLLPGVILFYPLLVLTGGRYTSIFPFSIHALLLGILNVCAYLAVPLATRAVIRSWKKGETWRDIVRSPTTMVVLGVGMLLLALNGAIQLWQGRGGPTDIANTVFGPLAAIGLWCLAYYQRRHGTTIRLAERAPPAWIRWTVPLAALTGAVIGGILAYGEARILGWSTTAAGVLSVTVTGVTVLMVWLVFRMMQRQ
ncbi:MAG: hypothetical protein ACE5K9_04565 [Candidatus Methylomirabilales bacterium]